MNWKRKSNPTTRSPSSAARAIPRARRGSQESAADDVAREQDENAATAASSTVPERDAPPSVALQKAFLWSASACQDGSERREPGPRASPRKQVLPNQAAPLPQGIFCLEESTRTCTPPIGSIAAKASAVSGSVCPSQSWLRTGWPLKRRSATGAPLPAECSIARGHPPGAAASALHPVREGCQRSRLQVVRGELACLECKLISSASDRHPPFAVRRAPLPSPSSNPRRGRASDKGYIR